MTTRNNAEKFWSLVDVKGPDACWIWKRKPSACGNAQWFWKGEGRLVHHVAFELAYGFAIPRRTRKEGSAGLVIRHSCDVPNCVNPDHLWVGTQVDNMRDRAERGRANLRVKITDSALGKLRRMFSTGKYTRVELARRFQLEASWVGRLVSGNCRRSKQAGLAAACYEVLLNR